MTTTTLPPIQCLCFKWPHSSALASRERVGHRCSGVGEDGAQVTQVIVSCTVVQWLLEVMVTFMIIKKLSCLAKFQRLWMLSNVLANVPIWGLKSDIHCLLADSLIVIVRSEEQHFIEACN